MCILVDTCVIGAVFNPHDTTHEDFKPVQDWIYNGPGKLLYGGTHYKNEMRPFLKIFQELTKARKTISLNDQCVDEEEKKVQSLESDPDFDDPHLIAILRVSKALLVCTKDKRAIKFLKKKELYLKKQSRPKLYLSKKNQNLLNSQNIPQSYNSK